MTTQLSTREDNNLFVSLPMYLFLTEMPIDTIWFNRVFLSLKNPEDTALTTKIIDALNVVFAE